MPEDWTWEYEGWDPAEERLRESLCTLGNGYFATRGAAPETTGGPAHYPGTYVAGCYNRLVSSVAGLSVENEDLVNLPNWLPLRYRIAETVDRPASAWFGPNHRGLLTYRQVLDLWRGTLTRQLRFTDRLRGDRRHLGVEQVRLVHMGSPHLAALRTTFTAEDWSGALLIESAIDGRTTNAGVERYRELDGHHLGRIRTAAEGPDILRLRCATRTSGIRVALAARTTAWPNAADGRAPQPVPLRVRLGERTAAHHLTVPITPGQPVVVEKVVALHTSHDPATSDPDAAALDQVARAPGFADLLESHQAAWERLWRRAELDVSGEPGRILRLHLFHVLQTLSPHTAELDVGVPARGLHGEAYRGHVFWDELFVLPYLNLHFPEVSRALLEYRHRRLPRACRAAEQTGRAGAMYPWQSGSDGREEAQKLHLNPRSGRWVADHSYLQHHVGSAIAYNVWRYGQASGDTEFLYTKGAETLLQIARFWASAAEYDPAAHRYRIRGVVGPDEYHDAYPGAPEPGVDDNAYTNVTAAWVLGRALELAETMPEPPRQELFERLGLADEELAGWEDISRRVRVPFHAGVISQFEGYGDLAELDWDGYREQYGDIRRLDRILEAEGDTTNRYQASKQADVLMLGYLFPPAELAAVFQRLGYAVDDALWRATVDYYLRRTSHGSTLSGVVHGWVLARARHSDAWKYCQEALTGDVADLQGGTTAEGIHLGAMAGTLDLVQRGLTGLEIRDDTLWLDPAPLPELSEFGLTLRYRGQWGIGLRMKPGQLLTSVPESNEAPVRFVLVDRAWHVTPGTERVVALPPAE
ncbi:glycoside hydrolase family 65 protein [Streptantibioticus ferralitis]|uniref:Glycoside hydrolase family 65 protein n=1 Tax=Streptantibioticus ferralitis TaxID=236510 RepID=A0ABT5YTL2_9ACTN|nr:glycosyl hydrolase family 65 protein [Streptantibioticus ferralitis]MDF2254948.1 glycoside hydrolase family 65 protein [Streptantibioticus ferralitis]